MGFGVFILLYNFLFFSKNDIYIYTYTHIVCVTFHRLNIIHYIMPFSIYCSCTILNILYIICFSVYILKILQYIYICMKFHIFLIHYLLFLLFFKRQSFSKHNSFLYRLCIKYYSLFPYLSIYLYYIYCALHYT